MNLELAAELFPGLMPAQEVAASGVPVYDDNEIERLMMEAEDPDTGLIRDLKIDDRDLYSAKNYYDYCYKVLGRDSNPPWIVQMWILIILLGEYCPRCSDKRWLKLEWFITHVDKRRPGSEITEGLHLLNNGVCPKCKTTKHTLIKEHGLRDYTELVAVLGQRSGKSVGLAAAVASYQLHRFLKFPKLADLAPNAMQKSTELTFTFVSLTTGRALSLLWTPFLNVINESTWFCLSANSPITLADNSKVLIKDLTPGTEVKTLEGTSTVTRVFNNGVQACFDLTLENGSVLCGTGSHQVRCLGADGESLVWKSIDDITDSDIVVTE